MVGVFVMARAWRKGRGAVGGGRKGKVPLCVKNVFEWWSSHSWPTGNVEGETNNATEK